jgi:hypothetical protein
VSKVGIDNELKTYYIEEAYFNKGLDWWEQKVAIKPSKEAFDVMIKVVA